MRFNDLLSTVLANMGEGTGATVTRWRQCIDLLAQYDVSGAHSANALAPEDRDSILGMIEDMRARLSADQRIASIAELGSRLRSPSLVRLLAQDHPSLVSSMMANVRLTDADWAAIIPDLGPLARSVLRRRTDLGERTQAALRQFGNIDMALPSLVAILETSTSTVIPIDRPLVAANTDLADEAPVRLPDEPSQIGRIVAQIERFTEARGHRQDDAGLAPSPEMAPPPEPAPVNAFTFEADPSGLITLATGAPRSAAIGLSIGMPELDSRHGADGLALGAFRRRAAFENARFAIGEGLLEGEWRMSAEPRFDRATGRFTGYAGAARREFPHESLVRSAPASGGHGWAGLSATSTRQLIHELRTPLNAIQGYAEMIESQLVGPVTDEYRDMARRILADAHALLATFDDLDMASRIERGDHFAADERIDLEAAVHSVIGSFAQGGDPRIDVMITEPLPGIGGDRGQIERMLGHLIRAGRAALAGDERLDVRLATNPGGGSVSIVMQRPRTLRGISDQELLDNGYLVDQKLNDAPALGLAFTLKLVRGIAQHLGGSFEIAPDAFGLFLPVMPAAEGEQEHHR
ncbi:sensor histidine kinase [Sphingobium nicotianae]|uniref:histidine kinase n=1 Tax=Sphingobium nicotianae TaxID=2782607 RepID=A0A9X1AJW4_9SPHN|nr:HAMP domain-containing sensor histidine kinase [Sphingobium nicotianae]MBT2185565.1 HAMP domain-containing histidine kinase [Sphingobium nicotianae]